MLNPDPKAIRTLLSRYADVQLRYSERPTLELQRQLDDVTYTLCVSTGTRCVSDALLAADRVLEAAAAPRSDDEPQAA
ncbi:DUF5133 domain-containing protein [Streptomyces sp. NPDC051684]|uniref:DUF5133 domain-containing protein n=1 Tax=Streptomyces sp. NPDC051684 TaxID=3365670 RepID=UPI0037932B76